MDTAYLASLVLTTFMALSSAEITTEDLHDIMDSKFDNIYFDIRNIRNDIKEISDKIETKGQNIQPENSEDLKEMLESVKTETDAKFRHIEEHMLKINQTIRKELAIEGGSRGGINAKVEKNLLTLRSAVKDGKKYVYELVSSFESRVDKVEQKMFAFENASWKGDKGDTGLPGPRGPAGYRGRKGERGLTGNDGKNGQKGSKGSQSTKGEKGETGRAGPRGFPGSEGKKGEKGEKGALGIKGIQGVKGQKGSPESRNSAYFAVSYKDHENTQLPSNTILKFDAVLRNIGNGYNKITGKFKAPYSGRYLFIFFVEVYGKKGSFVCVRLYVDGDYSAYALTESSLDDINASGGNAFIAYMNAGEEAWLQTCPQTGITHYLDGDGSTFTGVLLY